MNILYGVVGEGMGHATRSRVIIDHLAQIGHKIKIVVSNKAFSFLHQLYVKNPNVTVEEIKGLTFSFDEEGKLDLSDTIFENIKNAPKNLLENIKAYRRVAEDQFHPDLVISDFESWSFFYALNHFLPLISIANLQVLSHCRHDSDITDDDSFHFLVAKTTIKLKMPGAYHYLIPTFFYPEVSEERTTLVPPILRKEILEAKREKGEHILVYQTRANNEQFIQALQKLPHEFRVYGTGREEVLNNVKLCPFSETQFVEDMRTSKAIIGNAGFSLMGEAVHLQVPMLAVPIQGQYEQELNARYLKKLGYGEWCYELEIPLIQKFLNHLAQYEKALAQYHPQNNSIILQKVDQIIDRIQRGEEPEEFDMGW